MRKEPMKAGAKTETKSNGDIANKTIPKVTTH